MPDHDRGSLGAPAGRAGAAARTVPRAPRLGRPAQFAGVHAARDPRVGGTARPGRRPARTRCRDVRSRGRRGGPRPRPASRRSRRDAAPPVDPARRRAPRGDRRRDPGRRSPGHLPADAARRHRRAGGRRRDGVGGVVDPEPVLGFRVGHRRARDGDRGPEPRRVFHAGARASERVRAGQAAGPHPDAGAAPRRARPRAGGRNDGRLRAATDQRADDRARGRAGPLRRGGGRGAALAGGTPRAGGRGTSGAWSRRASPRSPATRSRRPVSRRSRWTRAPRRSGTRT